MLMADQQKIKSAVTAFIQQTGEAQTNLTPQQWTAFKTFWNWYVSSLHHHHDNEEKIAFPYLADVKKAVSKDKVTSDHITLLSGLAKVEEIVKAMTEKVDGPATSQPEEQTRLLRNLLESFTVLDEALVEHFHEEEDTFIPPIRKACSVKEFRKHVTNPIVGGMSWADRGQYFGKMNPDTQLKAFMKQEGIPFFVKWIFKSNIRKYNKMYVWPLEEAVVYANECVGRAVKENAVVKEECVCCPASTPAIAAGC